MPPATLKLSHFIATPASLIGTSDFFELAVAVAIFLFGLHSSAALATVLEGLIEKASGIIADIQRHPA